MYKLIKKQKEVFILFGFLKTIKVDTEEEFIRVLLEQECVTLRVEVKREVFGCPSFKEASPCEEIFSYTTEFSAKNKKGEKVVFLKKWEQDIEYAGDAIYEISHLLHAIEAEKKIMNEIRELIPGIDTWVIIPKKKYFNNGGYEKVIEAVNK